MKKLCISVIILYSSVSYAADFSNFLDDAWQGMVAGSHVSAAGTISAQGGTYYSGGGYTYTSPSATFKPLSVRAPSLKAGCTGISIDMGAFNYNEEQLIAFLKALISGAKGYAFNLAMQVLCPQCTDLMNTMNEMAGLINGMQFDSCGIINAAGDKLKNYVANTSFNNDLDQGGKNWFNSAIKSVNDKASSGVKWAQELDKRCISTLGLECPTKFIKGEKTLLQVVAEKPVIKRFDDQIIDLVRAFIGDVYIKDGKVLVSSPIYPFTHKDVLNLLINGDERPSVNIEILRHDGNLYMSGFVPFAKVASVNLNAIRTAFTSRNRLTQDNLNFLAMFKSPVYKILNSTSSDTQSLNNFIENFKSLAGKQLMYEVMSAITTETNQIIGIINNELKTVDMENIETIKEDIAKLQQNLRVFSETAFDIYSASYAEFDKSMAELEKVKSMTERMQSLMARHPVMGGAFFSRGMAK